MWIGEGLAQQRLFTIWGKDLFAAAAAEVVKEFWLTFAGEAIPVLSIIYRYISDREKCGCLGLLIVSAA